MTGLKENQKIKDMSNKPLFDTGEKIRELTRIF
jgi:hypothetical protein